MVFRVCEDAKNLGSPVRISTVFNKLLSLQGAFVHDVQFLPEAIMVTVRRLHGAVS